MQLATLPFIAGWLLLYFSTSGWQIVLGLALSGFGGGLLEAPVITYVAEITQPKLRGALCSTSTTSFALGSLIQFFIGTVLPWRKVALVNCFFPMICLIVLFLIPESPVWLLMKNKPEEAKKSLLWLRGWTTSENIEEEFEQLSLKIVSESFDNNKPKSLIHSFKYLGRKEVYCPMLLVLFIYFLLYFNGSTTITVYAVEIFHTLNAPVNEYYATIIMGSVQFLGSLCCVTIIRFTGKRLLNFICLVGSGFCCLLIASYIFIKRIYYLNQTENVQEEQWVPVIFLIIFSFLAYAGPRILPWILIGEVFPTRYSPKATGLAAAIGYALGFIPNKIFLAQVDSMTLPGVFLYYACICFLGFTILYFVLPETEGKTLFEITDHFLGMSKLGNDVRRKEKLKKEKSTGNGIINSSLQMAEDEVNIV